MEGEKIKIRNQHDEKLDVLVSGNMHSPTAIVFAHGFGSNKNENFDLFADIASLLENDFRIIRFDFSGYGESEGRQEDVDLQKMEEDLRCIIEYAKSTHAKVFLVAHSMGTFAASKLQSFDIERIVFTSPPNPNTDLLIANMQDRIQKNGGTVNENGISIYKRTSGQTQRIGPNFWKSIRQFDPIRNTKMLGLHSMLAVFDPTDDEIVRDRDTKHWWEYRALGIKYVGQDGNHNFEGTEDRANLIKEINFFFRKTNMIFVAHQISGNETENLRKVSNICRDIHSKDTIPVFPSFTWRQYLGTNHDDMILAKGVNKEYFERGFIDGVWNYGGTLSAGMKDELKLALSKNVPIIGKTPEMVQEMMQYLKI